MPESRLQRTREVYQTLITAHDVPIIPVTDARQEMEQRCADSERRLAPEPWMLIELTEAEARMEATIQTCGENLLAAVQKVYANQDSTQFCGCDAGAGWTCEQHRASDG